MKTICVKNREFQTIINHWCPRQVSVYAFNLSQIRSLATSLSVARLIAEERSACTFELEEFDAIEDAELLSIRQVLASSCTLSPLERLAEAVVPVGGGAEFSPFSRRLWRRH